MILFQKILKQGVDDMEFPEVLKKAWKFQGSIKNAVEFPGGVFKKKNMWNSHGSWFLILVFGIPPRCVTILQNL